MCEQVRVMERLRHPNVLLFLGAVDTPAHCCIVTELMPRYAPLLPLLSHCIQCASACSAPPAALRRRVGSGQPGAALPLLLHCVPG